MSMKHPNNIAWLLGEVRRSSHSSRDSSIIMKLLLLSHIYIYTLAIIIIAAMYSAFITCLVVAVLLDVSVVWKTLHALTAMSDTCSQLSDYNITLMKIYLPQ